MEKPVVFILSKINGKCNRLMMMNIKNPHFRHTFFFVCFCENIFIINYNGKTKDDESSRGWNQTKFIIEIVINLFIIYKNTMCRLQIDRGFS